MHARVVRFTDVDKGRLEEVTKRIESGDGPPEGVPAKGIKVMHDADQSTAVVVISFESEEALREGAETLDKMDAGETPGTRASIDVCEVVAEMNL